MLILPVRIAWPGRRICNCGRDVPPPSLTSISSGRTGNRDETQVDLAPARVRFNVKTLVGCLLLLVATGILIFLSRERHSQRQSSQTQTVTTTVKTFPLMTFPGEIEGLALSPDASQIAFTWNGPNLAKWDIYVQHIGGDRPLQITHTQSGMITGVSWSPDGRLLAFGRCGDQNRGAIYTIPALGGPDRKLTDIACDWGEAQASWTPDGQSLVFSDACTPGGSLGIAVFTLTTRAEAMSGDARFQRSRSGVSNGISGRNYGCIYQGFDCTCARYLYCSSSRWQRPPAHL